MERRIVKFGEVITFNEITINGPRRNSPRHLVATKKVIPVFLGDHLGGESFPYLKPGEFCQSDDGKSIYCHLQED